MLYLVETLTIQPSEMKDYKRSFVSDYIPLMTKVDVQLYGLWQTWRTNELWAFWEVKDWATLDKLDKAAEEDQALVKYTEKAVQKRLHWTNRLFLPAPFSNDLAALKKKGIKGSVYNLAVIPVDPPKINDWLDLYPQYGMRLADKHGLKLVGYWVRGGGEPYQFELRYCTELTCTENWASNDDYGKAIEADPEVQKWWRLSQQYRTHHKASHLLPVYLPY